MQNEITNLLILLPGELHSIGCLELPMRTPISQFDLIDGEAKREWSFYVEVIILVSDMDPLDTQLYALENIEYESKPNRLTEIIHFWLIGLLILLPIFLVLLVFL